MMKFIFTVFFSILLQAESQLSASCTLAIFKDEETTISSTPSNLISRANALVISFWVKSSIYSQETEDFLSVTAQDVLVLDLFTCGRRYVKAEVAVIGNTKEVLQGAKLRSNQWELIIVAARSKAECMHVSMCVKDGEDKSEFIEGAIATGPITLEHDQVVIELLKQGGMRRNRLMKRDYRIDLKFRDLDDIIANYENRFSAHKSSIHFPTSYQIHEIRQLERSHSVISRRWSAISIRRHELLLMGTIEVERNNQQLEVMQIGNRVCEGTECLHFRLSVDSFQVSRACLMSKDHMNLPCSEVAAAQSPFSLLFAYCKSASLSFQICVISAAHPPACGLKITRSFNQLTFASHIGEDLEMSYVQSDGFEVKEITVEIDDECDSQQRLSELISELTSHTAEIPTPKLPLPGAISNISSLSYHRRLQADHFAVFSVDCNLNLNEVKSFTFYNKHTATQAIVIELANYGPGMLTVQFSDSSVILSVFEYQSRAVNLLAGHNYISSRRGGVFTGSYKILITDSNSSTYIQLRIRIKCSAPPGNCFCQSGYYTNPITSSCSQCPAGDTDCSNFDSNGCLLVQDTPVPPFSCTKCVGRIYDPTTGRCLCDPACKMCTGLTSSECQTCMPKTNGIVPCACASAYYVDTVNMACSACDSNCATCSGGAEDQCLSCKTNASLNGSPPCKCKCNPGYGYYPSNCTLCDPKCNNGSSITCNDSLFVDAKCLECDLDCQTCYWGGKGECTSCKYTNNSIRSGTYGPCRCLPGFYPNPNIDNCSPCNPTCYECNKGGPTDCESCKALAVLSAGQHSSCKCAPGAYANSDAGNCAPCASTCMICSGSAWANCSDCFPQAELSPGVCKCKDGYYAETTAINCVACHASCKTCNGAGAWKCVSCKKNAEISTSSLNSCVCKSGASPTPSSDNCVCQPGYYEDAVGCTPCHSTCKTCTDSTDTKCSLCFDHATETAGSCVCNSGYYSSSPPVCSPCYFLCKECSGASFCTSCILTAIISSSPGNCVCISGHYPDSVVSNCSLCNSECKECLGGASLCTDCHTDAHLNGSTCECNTRFFPNIDAGHCTACSTLCDECIGASPSECKSCRTNAALSAAAPSSCICNSATCPVFDVGNCKPCHSTCSECVGVLESECKLCKSNANIENGAVKGKCICNAGYFPDSTSADCHPCHGTCVTCIGNSPVQCQSCYPSASIENNALTGKCICDSGYFSDPSSAHCSPCHIFCKECEGVTETQCTDCKDLANLTGSPPSSCECNLAAFPSPNAGSCKMCSEGCMTCSDLTSASCLSCWPSAHLKGSPPSECECKQGFIPSPNASSCLPCNPVCGKCVTLTECSECKMNAVLKGGICVCIRGFYGEPDASNCKPCADECLECIATGCSKCKLGLLLFEGQCASECPREHRANVDGECESMDMTPPTPSLSVTSDNFLSVFFDKPMNCSISISDINIEIQTPNNRDVSYTWTEPQFQSSLNLLIELKFESDYLPSDSKVTLMFLKPEDIVDEFDIPISINKISGSLNPFGLSPANFTGVLLQTPAAQQAAAASKGSVSAGAVSSFVNGNPACLMSLVNQLQLITYLSMTKLPLPADFASTLAALNVGQMIPNPFPDFVFSKRNETSQVPPNYVRDYGIASTLFVMNSMSFIGTSCAVLLSFVPFYFLSKVKIKFVADYFKSKLPSLKWNVPVQLWLTSYLDIGVFSLLQLSNASNSVSNWFTGISLCFSGIFAGMFVLTPLFLMYFFVRNFNLICSRSDSSFNQKWGALFLPFKSDFHFSNVAFYIVFTVRRFILAVTIVLFPDSLTVIALLNTSFSVVVSAIQTFFYLLISRPFSGTLDAIEGIITEGSTMIVYILASSFTFELSDELKSLIGLLGMWMVRIAIFSSVGISMFRTATMVIGLVKAYEERVKRIEGKYHLSNDQKSEEVDRNLRLGQLL